MEPSIKLEHADSRGEIYSILLPNGHELMLLHSTAGAFRGGHSHDCDEVVVLLEGQMDYHKVKNGINRVFKLEGPSSSFNPAGEIHMGEFRSESWVVEYKCAKKGEWTQSNHEPYREKVRASCS